MSANYGEQKKKFSIIDNDEDFYLSTQDEGLKEAQQDTLIFNAFSARWVGMLEEFIYDVVELVNDEENE